MRKIVAIVFLALLGSAQVAFAQPVPAAPPAASAPQLEARAITTACGALPPADHTPPALSAADRLRYQRLLLSATGEYQQGRAHFAAALSQNWAAYLLNPTPEVGEQIAIILDALGTAASDYRCAFVSCLVPRTPPGNVRDQLVAEQAYCVSQTPTGPTPTPTVSRIALTGEVLQAVQSDTALVAEIRRDHAADTSVATTWQVPNTYQSRVEAALARFRLSRATTAPTPTARRSMVGYALPVGLWAAGAGALVGAVVSTSAWSSGNAQLVAANAGQSNGWPRQVEADTRNAALRAEILFPLAAALVGGGVAAWVGLAPHQLTVTPTVAPHAFGASATLRF